VTIFQKMILVPVLSLLLFAGFIVYSFFEYQQSNRNINLLRADYIPVMELVSDNIRLLEKLRDRFKDVVLASELLWLDDTLVIRKQVQANFLELEKYPEIVEQKNIIQSRKDFEHYFASASKLARRLVTDKALWLSDDNLNKDVELYLNTLLQQFSKMRKDVYQYFAQTIDDTSFIMKQLLFWGGIIAFSAMLILIVVTLIVSISTRNGINLIVERTKSLALGDTDFSLRISRANKDELGNLVYWFNQLSDKKVSLHLFPDDQVGRELFRD